MVDHNYWNGWTEHHQRAVATLADDTEHAITNSQAWQPPTSPPPPPSPHSASAHTSP